MWRRISTKISNSQRRIFRRDIHLLTSKPRIHRIIGAIGAVAIGGGLCLSMQSQILAKCDPIAGTKFVPTGPKIKSITSLDELKRDNSFEYVVLGSGVAAWTVVKSISKNEPGADILVVTLSETPQTEQINLQEGPINEAYFEWRDHVVSTIPPNYGPDITPLTKLMVLVGHSNYFIDTSTKEILFADGSGVKYGKVCVASNGKPRRVVIKDKSKQVGAGAEDIGHHLNMLEDKSAFKRLETGLNCLDASGLPLHPTTAVVGGGFLGTQIALASLTPGRKVIHIYPEDCVLSNYVPSYLAMHTSALLRKAGVLNIANVLVKDVALERTRSMDTGDGFRHNRVKLNFWGDISSILAHYVTVASTKIIPDVLSCRNSYFEIDKATGGVCVNRYLEVDDNVFVAGNSASYFDVSLGRRRVRTRDHAIQTGLVVGKNMASKDNKLETYTYQPGFRTKFEKIGVDAIGVGIIDANLKTVGIWSNKVDELNECTSALRQGIVYYVKEEEGHSDEIVGCLLWNNSDKVEDARKILSSRESRTVSNLIALKQKIHIDDPNSLNIMVEKNSVPSVAQMIKRFKSKKGDKKSHK